jgi:integrative and conjugative element protein (TIGR02256 family)
MNGQRQLDSSAPEAGGMLLGRLIVETNHVVIDEATIPMKGDRRGRFFYNRSKARAQQHINLAWEISERTRNYLGEWHTHPEDDPSPSGHDLNNWRRIAEIAQYEQDYLIFAIVGRENTRAWEFNKIIGAPDELEHLSLPMNRL